MLERAADARAQRALDLISENVVPYAHVIAAPLDDSRPGQAGEKGARSGGPFALQ